MIQPYTKKHFEEDKKEFIQWLKKNWNYGDTYFGNILKSLKWWVEDIKRNEK